MPADDPGWGLLAGTALLVLLPLSYVPAAVVGIPVGLLLRRWRMAGLGAWAGAGALVGGVLLAFAGAGTRGGMLVDVPTGAVCGGAAFVTHWAIAVRPRARPGT